MPKDFDWKGQGSLRISYSIDGIDLTRVSLLERNDGNRKGWLIATGSERRTTRGDWEWYYYTFGAGGKSRRVVSLYDVLSDTDLPKALLMLSCGLLRATDATLC